MIYDGLKLVLQVVSDSPVLIQSGNDKVYVATYDKDHVAIYTSLHNNAPEYRVVLSYDTAKQLLTHFNGGKIEVKDDVLNVSLGKSKASFSTIDENISLTSLTKKYSDENPIRIDPGEFRRLYAETVHSSNNKSIGDVRFQGFHLAHFGDSTEVMTTDGTVISLATTPHQSPALDEPIIIINNPGFSKIPPALAGAKDLSLSISDDTLSLVAMFGDDEAFRVISSLVRGTPIGYQAVVERTRAANTSEYRISNAAFSEALTKVAYFSAGDENKEKIILNIDKNVCTISATNGKGSTSLDVDLTPVDTKQEQWTIATDRSYLHSYLKSTKHEDITMRLGGDKLPMLFEAGTSTEIISVKAT